MAFQISGIQQLGVGVDDVYIAWDWYREHFGQDVLLSDAPGEASMMQPYTAHKPQTRHTILAYNMQGGGGLEIWQYTSRKPTHAPFDIKLGDLLAGIAPGVGDHTRYGDGAVHRQRVR